MSCSKDLFLEDTDPDDFSMYIDLTKVVLYAVTYWEDVVLEVCLFITELGSNGYKKMYR